MNKPFVATLISLFLSYMQFSDRCHASISVYISPGDTQQAVFSLTGQFDGPFSSDAGYLSAFSFGTFDMWSGSSQSTYTVFSSPVASIVNVTRGISSDIKVYAAYYGYMEFDLYPALYVQPGDEISLVTHGQVTGSSFADFVPGDFVFTNSAMGPTTFEVHVVPEPAVQLLVFGGLGFLVLNRRTCRVLLENQAF